MHERLPSPLSSEFLEEYELLRSKLRAETLREPEYARLLELSDEIEEHNARRIEVLIELSRDCGVPLEELLSTL